MANTENITHGSYILHRSLNARSQITLGVVISPAPQVLAVLLGEVQHPSNNLLQCKSVQPIDAISPLLWLQRQDNAIGICRGRIQDAAMSLEPSQRGLGRPVLKIPGEKRDDAI